MITPDLDAESTLEERRRHLDSRLSAAGINMGYGTPLHDEITQVEQLLDCTETMHVERRREAVGALLLNIFEADYGRNVRAVNDVLLPLGRCISPAYMPGGVFTEIRRRCERISSAISTGEDFSADVAYVVEQIARTYFAPHIRAFMIVRAKRLPYLNLISHYLDDAAIAFYRRNYFACANALATAIERLLLGHVEWKFGEKNMHHPELRAAVAALTARSGNIQMDGRFETYKQYVIRFLEEYQKPSNRANLSASRFNRAFIQHVNDDGSYYTYDDCITAFQFFDLYVEFVSAQVGQEMYAFVPEDDDEMNLRSKYYWRTILEDWLHGASPSTERALLESNPHYQKDAIDSNFLSLHAAGPDQNRMIGSALMTLGVPNLVDILPLVRDPIDSERLGHLAKLVTSLAVLMAPDKASGQPA